MAMDNTLYYGDNLSILRNPQYFQPESVDLIYLDPPFNSSRNYNVLFKDEKGQAADSQIVAFEDSWHWTPKAEETYHDLVTKAPERISNLIGTLRGLLGTSQMMAYLVMMTARLVELHRVLKPTGSLYLHCDPSASHYLKIVLDTIFDPSNFRNELIWKRRTGSSSAVHQSNKYGVCTDSVFFYAKSDKAKFKPQYNLEAAGYQEYIDKFFKFTDENGRRYRLADLANPALRPNLIYEYKGYQPPRNGWAIKKEKMELWDKQGRLYFPKDPNGRIQRKRFLDELKGKPVQSLWDDIEPLSSQSGERLGYPTQKPLALLERIISASSNPGDVVLDPFCGCGTAIAAAEKLGRKWIGIDITHLSIALQKFRMAKMFPGITFKVVGEPLDIGAARQLALDDRYQFQWWALSLVRAMPLGGESSSSSSTGERGGRTGKKGSDKGIDGIITFLDDNTGKPKKVLIQVKSGKVGSALIRDLRGTLEREKAALAAFITLEPATRDMLTEATSAGFYTSPGWGKNYPKIQILTVEDLIKGKIHLEMPPAGEMFKAAQRTTRVSEHAAQGQLFPTSPSSFAGTGAEGTAEDNSDDVSGEGEEFED